ncbi:DUF4260 domain-containing protein [Mesonia sp.]|uniref:DUF4260 domain-containing protein n=1 Tax=Mesonia sp. TaxID=1960830 RepID=UPI00175DAFC7|nr:DUF4260 domain-containing protein [Mesonia sp.]HIB37712.1 DUF4260 family protein [Mesonia sp.]HIO26331.1 DUF4260 family protein [Flavobacteriaceae bacterium]
MKTSLKLEELAMLLLGIFLFSQLNFSWWWFIGLFLAPDLGMLGYLINTKVGAFTYNLFHHKFVAIAIYFFGIFITSEIVQMIGILLFSHASFDRIFGYGLKYEKGFKFTHLGEIGK